MEIKNDNPKTLVEAVKLFADTDVCLAYLIPLVWPKGIACRHCGGADPMFLKSRGIWKCRACRKQFSIKTGTIMEDSPLGLDKWLVATWLIASAKNGISSYEIHRALGVTQKTAWFLLHRIRLAMQTGSFTTKLGGQVEVDETYIGGLSRNMHAKKRRKMVTGSGPMGSGKSAVMGLLQRNGEVRTMVVAKNDGATLKPHVRQNVEAGAALFTDAMGAYRGLDAEYVHNVIDHAVCYVKGNVHTNGLENYWSLLKRGLKGTYVAVEPFHLFRYIDEQTFRFNSRKTNDGQRFAKALGGVRGKRLTYKALIGNGVSSLLSPDSGEASV